MLTIAAAAIHAPSSVAPSALGHRIAQAALELAQALRQLVSRLHARLGDERTQRLAQPFDGRHFGGGA
jgi:hypothetical protein